MGKGATGYDEIDQCTDAVELSKLLIQHLDLILYIWGLLSEVLKIVSEKWVSCLRSMDYLYTSYIAMVLLTLQSATYL